MRERENNVIVCRADVSTYTSVYKNHMQLVIGGFAIASFAMMYAVLKLVSEVRYQPAYEAGVCARSAACW